MGSVDNALAETINGLYKAELIHKQSWKKREAVELATLTWIDWFNHRRLLGPIANIPPAEAEAIYYQQLSESAMAAWLTTESLRDFRGGSVRFAHPIHGFALGLTDRTQA